MSSHQTKPSGESDARADLPLPLVDVQIAWDSPAEVFGVRALIDYVRAPAAHDLPQLEQLDYEIFGGRSGLSLMENGRVVARSLSGRSAVDTLYRRSHERVFALLAADGWIRLHGGLFDLDGRRHLLSGPSEAGKSTLLAHVLVLGAEVSGDEWVLWRDGVAWAFPRRMHLGPATPDLIPTLAPVWDQLDRFPLPDGELSRALDPTVLGRPWRVTEAPIDAVISLEPRNEGPSRLAPLPASETVRRLVDQAFADSTNASKGQRGPLVADICQLVNDASCWSLTANQLPDIEAMLKGMPLLDA